MKFDLRTLTILLSLLSILAFTPITAADAPVAEKPFGCYALLGGKIVTISGETLNGAAVLVSGGKIENIVDDPDHTYKPPEGYEVIDARERWILPGFVDLHSHIGGMDINEMVYPVNSGLRVLDNIRANNPRLQKAVAGGVTTILFIPGSGTNISGFGALMKTAGKDVDEILVRFPGALKIAQGGNPERKGGDLGLYRMGMNYLIREALREGKIYTDAWDAFEAGNREKAPVKNPRLEYFRGLFHRDYPVVVHTQGAALIQSTLRILHDELKLWVVIDHGTFDGFKLAGEVTKRGVMVMNGPRQFEFDREEGKFIGLAAEWEKGGIKDVGINTDAPVIPQEELFFQAAMAVRLGLDPDVALRGLTLSPAKAMGIDDRLGSIEKGKDADLVIWTGDPFDIRNYVTLVLVNGRVHYDIRKEPRRF
jgi:imidazolonepropionase-like amidohydrolase